MLANVVLAEVDVALGRARLPSLRWVDDIVVALRRPDDADAALGTIDRALGSLGLERHPDKTRVVLDLAGANALGAVSAVR